MTSIKNKYTLLGYCENSFTYCRLARLIEIVCVTQKAKAIECDKDTLCYV